MSYNIGTGLNSTTPRLRERLNPNEYQERVAGRNAVNPRPRNGVVPQTMQTDPSKFNPARLTEKGTTPQ